jgi:hypothetical protein
MAGEEGQSLVTLLLLVGGAAVAALVLWSLLKALLKTALVIAVVALTVWGAQELFPEEVALLRAEILALIGPHLPFLPGGELAPDPGSGPADPAVAPAADAAA